MSCGLTRNIDNSSFGGGGGGLSEAGALHCKGMLDLVVLPPLTVTTAQPDGHQKASKPTLFSGAPGPNPGTLEALGSYELF